MNVFRKLKAYLRFYEAVIMANSAHAKNSQRYYVVSGSSDNVNLMVVDRQNFRILKRKHYISDKATMRDLKAESFYYTPYSNGYGGLTPEQCKLKREQYYSWCNAIYQLRKQKKLQKKQSKKLKK